MKFQSVEDIYSANRAAAQRFRSVVSGVSEAEASARPEGENWSIAEIVEHVSIVDSGIAMLCSRLLEGAKAAGKESKGSVAVSDDFLAGAMRVATEKLEAPDRVKPTGSVAISDSVAKMDANAATIEKLGEELSKFDLSSPTFPHPYLGDMTAAEWLVMYGGHQARHAAQIERVLEKIRQ